MYLIYLIVPIFQMYKVYLIITEYSFNKYNEKLKK